MAGALSVALTLERKEAMATEIDSDRLLLNAIHDGVREGVKSKLTGYNSPLDKLIQQSIEQHGAELRSLLENAISSSIESADFREEITQAVNRSLAKTLIQRFGGEIEKQVNVLKSDPITRARITMAIEEIVKSQNAVA